jgi:HK97 family phage major capsid protein
MPDLLVRSAVHRARSALDLLDGASRDPSPPFPFCRYIARVGDHQTELPQRVTATSERYNAKGIGPKRGGIAVRAADFLQRDLTTSTGTGTAKAGLTIGTARTPVVRELGQPSVVLAAGARLLELDANASVPTIDGAPVASWVGEAVAPSQAAPVFGVRSPSPKTVSAWVRVSRRLRLQASESVDLLIEEALRRALGRAIDEVALGSGGANKPTGVHGVSGVNTVSLGTSGNLTRAKVIELFTSVADDGGVDFDSRLGLIVPPAVASKIARTEAATGSGFLGEFTGNGPTMTVAGMPSLVSGTAPSASASFGDWSRMLVVMFGPLEVLVDPRADAGGAVSVGVTAEVDIVLEHPQAFSIATGITTT